MVAVVIQGRTIQPMFEDLSPEMLKDAGFYAQNHYWMLAVDLYLSDLENLYAYS